MRATWVFAIAASVGAGCGFRLDLSGDGGPNTDGAVDPDGPDGRDAPDGPDAAPDAAMPTTCLGKWQAKVVSLSNPVPLANISTAGNVGDPMLTPDELTLFFVWNGNQFADTDIWVAERTSLSAPFGKSSIKESISSLSSNDSKLAVNSADSFVGVVSSARVGSEGGFDFFEAKRMAGGNAGFSAASTTNLLAVNDASDQLDPFLNANATRLYFAAGSPQQIRMASRPTVSSAFTAAVPVQGLGSSTENDADPTLTPDETVLVFASNRAAPTAQDNLWYAVRSDANAAFEAPLVVPNVNSASMDGDPYLSPDACRLYFASSRNGTSDLFVSTVQ